MKKNSKWHFPHIKKEEKIKTDKKICFSIPAVCSQSYISTSFKSLMEKRPEAFYEDVCIDSVYGSTPCKWNGGRYIEVPTQFDLEYYIKNNVEFWNQRDIPVRYTFTNLLIDELNLYNDEIGNKIIKETLKVQTKKNDININIEKFKDYIEKEYGKDCFNFVYSTTLNLNNVDDINKYSENNIVVPSYQVNNNFDLLKQLKHKENIELLADESCISNCPYRKEHYDYLSKLQAGVQKDKTFECKFMSEYATTFIHNINNANEKKHFITNELIREKYLPMGINHFKLVGRKYPMSYFVESLMYYFVKPEYRDEMREILLSQTVDDMYYEFY